jgi:hypothetical protein
MAGPSAVSTLWRQYAPGRLTLGVCLLACCGFGGGTASARATHPVVPTRAHSSSTRARELATPVRARRLRVHAEPLPAPAAHGRLHRADDPANSKLHATPKNSRAPQTSHTPQTSRATKNSRTPAAGHKRHVLPTPDPDSQPMLMRAGRNSRHTSSHAPQQVAAARNTSPRRNDAHETDQRSLTASSREADSHEAGSHEATSREAEAAPDAPDPPLTFGAHDRRVHHEPAKSPEATTPSAATGEHASLQDFLNADRPAAPAAAPVASVSAMPGSVFGTASGTVSSAMAGPARSGSTPGDLLRGSPMDAALRAGRPSRTRFVSSTKAAQTLMPANRAAEARVIDAAVTPMLLPQLAMMRGRLVTPPPMKGTHDILVHQNTMADSEGLARIADDDALDRMVAAHQLAPLTSSAALEVNSELPFNRRYARTWTVAFVNDLARAYHARFGEPLQLNSAVRTVAYQLKLQRINGNAASVEGDTASPHLTGQAIDFGKKGMSVQEIAWMRQVLAPLMDAGKIDVEEEFQQACFHISVYRSYTSGRHAAKNELAESQMDAPQLEQ